MGTREDQRRRTRATILLAAAAEFEERGYEASSYASIAARADLAKSLVSYHFASKTEIVDELFSMAFQGGAFSATPVEPDAPLDELVRTAVHVAVQEQTNVVARAALRLQREATIIPTHMPPSYQGWVTRCRTALTRAVALGQLPPCVDAGFEARLLVAQFIGIRELTAVLGDDDRFVMSTVVGTLDRFATMGACPSAVMQAAASAACMIREAGLGGADDVVERVVARYPDQSTTTPSARANAAANSADWSSDTVAPRS